jgi:hypothetical protein
MGVVFKRIGREEVLLIRWLGDFKPEKGEALKGGIVRPYSHLGPSMWVGRSIYDDRGVLVRKSTLQDNVGVLLGEEDVRMVRGGDVISWL